MRETHIQDGIDTLDFSQSSVGITIDLDTQGTDQLIDTAGQVVRLVGQLENFVGSDQSDTVTVELSSIQRQLDGADPAAEDLVPGDPGDQLWVNGLGQQVTFDSGQVNVAGFGQIDYTNFEGLFSFNTGSVTIDAGLDADDGVADIFQVSADGTTMTVEVNFIPVYSIEVQFIPNIIIQGSGDDDVLQLFLQGNPIPNGLGFLGAGQMSADTLVLFGAGVESGVYEPDPESFGSGTITIDSSVIKFTGLEPVIVSDMQSFQLTTPGSEDNLIVDSTAAGPE